MLDSFCNKSLYFFKNQWSSFHLKKLEKEVQKWPQSKQREAHNKDKKVNESSNSRTKGKINETKSWPLRKFSEIGTLLASLIKKMRKDKNYKYQKKRWGITPEPPGI